MSHKGFRGSMILIQMLTDIMVQIQRLIAMTEFQNYFDSLIQIQSPLTLGIQILIGSLIQIQNNIDSFIHI